MSSTRGETRVSERGKRITSRDHNSPFRNTKAILVSPEHKLHVPNYMRPTISSSLSQSQYRSISSTSSKESIIRSSFKKSTTSPCPRVNRSSSFNHVPSSPRKSKNKLLEPSKTHFSKDHRVPALSRNSSCIALSNGDDMNQTKITMNIEDHDHGESSAISHIIEGHCDLVLEDNARVMVVDQVDRCDYDPDTVFDEVQAMVLEDYNCHNEIHPEIVEDNKEHIDVLQIYNHDQPCSDVDITKNTNEIHPPSDDIENSYEIYQEHVDIENSNEIHLPVIQDDKVLEDVHLMVIDEDKVLIEDVHDTEDCHDENSREIASDVMIVHEDEDEKDGIVEVKDEKVVMIVHEDDHDHAPNYMKQDHFETSFTNLDINEENKVSISDKFNAKHQNQEQHRLNVTESQEKERNQGDLGTTSTDVTKEAMEFEVEKESTAMNEQVKEPTPTPNPNVVTQASQEQNETKKASINKRFIINKKEPTVAYNDVIEETRSKLVQDRKNKVKALVGAFETVMSIDKR